jgi:Mg/Co/Ni transporter MgtE
VAANLREMAHSDADSESLGRIEARAVGAGAAAGVIAGFPMGLLLHFGTDLLPVLGTAAGETSVVRGWLVHLFVSLLYGVAFAMVLAYPPVGGLVGEDQRDYGLAGVVYATMIAAVTIGLLPLVLELPWVPGPIEFPNASGRPLGGLGLAAVFGVAHLVYGAVLGFAYVLVGDAAD